MVQRTDSPGFSGAEASIGRGRRRVFLPELPRVSFTSIKGAALEFAQGIGEILWLLPSGLGGNRSMSILCSVPPGVIGAFFVLRPRSSCGWRPSWLWRIGAVRWKSVTSMRPSRSGTSRNGRSSGSSDRTSTQGGEAPRGLEGGARGLTKREIYRDVYRGHEDAEDHR